MAAARSENGPLAIKLLNLAVAVGALAAVRRLARSLQVGRTSVAVISWALVVPLIAAGYSVLSPDLLVRGAYPRHGGFGQRRVPGGRLARGGAAVGGSPAARPTSTR